MHERWDGVVVLHATGQRRHLTVFNIKDILHSILLPSFLSSLLLSCNDNVSHKKKTSMKKGYSNCNCVYLSMSYYDVYMLHGRIQYFINGNDKCSIKQLMKKIQDFELSVGFLL